ncbi:hypothetical protein SCP_1400350 [Sparassis crispa]|uniref:Uncharacterized protein n=1 Tax=Sparassis crispa TaxID=139825 RepID=A0A401H2P1_9APHY|nr:hypothetical protein SCP_1400350 [Sparassis crispa]GBE88630.1 hypothetical protein SCP_1400350 [Sparassis crispa]
MRCDADCIISKDLVDNKQLLDFYFNWVFAQETFDVRKAAMGDDMSIKPRQRPMIYITKRDPREEQGANSSLLEYIFDFIHIATPLCNVDIEIAELQAQRDEEDRIYRNF